jgi:hypothetical protein
MGEIQFRFILSESSYLYPALLPVKRNPLEVIISLDLGAANHHVVDVPIWIPIQIVEQQFHLIDLLKGYSRRPKLLSNLSKIDKLSFAV